MLLSWPWIAELLPPLLELPHATILWPPQHQAAKAPDVEATLGCCTTAVRCSPSWIPAACNDSMCLVRARFWAVTSFRNFRPKDSWARTCKSWAVESCGSSSVLLHPLGKIDTLTRSMPMDQHADWDAGWVNTWENTRAWNINIFFCENQGEGVLSHT